MTQPDDSNNPTKLIEQIWEEQIRSWKNGSLIPAESFLERYPQLRDQIDQALDVVFNEYAILAGDESSSVSSEEFYRRFPDLQQQLESQFKLFDAVNDAALLETNPALDTGFGLGIPGAPENDGLDNAERFEYRRELGRGASSVVYEAWDNQLQRTVAIKKPHLSADRSSRVRERLIQEAHAVARLHHPGIVPIREICDSGDGVFLVSPLVEGRDLGKLTAEGIPDQTKSVQWFLEIASALDYAHENGIIHRDVKPSNVIINRDGRAMLTDFGLALNINARLSITQTGELIGTPAFMPPEQISSDERSDRRSDVYSLGALMYYVLSAKLPFDGSFSSVIHQVISSDPIPLRQLALKTPRELEIITAKCLNKAPGDRYASARDLADDLRKFQVGEVISAKPTGPLERVIKFTRRRPYWVTAIAALCFAVAFSAGLLLQLSNVVGQRDRAQSAERSNRELLGQASVDAGRLALQRGRLATAANHFENALEQEFDDQTLLHLYLVECYLALGRLREATDHLGMASTSTDNRSHRSLIDYWKAELAANGVTQYGNALELIKAANVGELEPAKRKFLEGINSSNSREALARFREALTHDLYHHSARRMSLIMALSLAEFDELLEEVAIAQQVYPEDIDFKLLEALALAAEDRLEAAELVVRQSGLDQDSCESWLKFVRFLRENTRHLHPNGLIGQFDLAIVANRLSKFGELYAPLLVERGWRFPTRIAAQFESLPQGEQDATDFEGWRAITRNLVTIHPEATLLVIAAESELDKSDTVEQLEAARELYLKATDAPSFVDDASDGAWLGVVATALNLAMARNHEVEINNGLGVLACRNLEPTRIANTAYLRVFSIFLINNGEYDLASKFVDQWVERSTGKGRDDALWHRASVYQARSEWQQVLQICDDVLDNNEDYLTDERKMQWQKYRLKASISLKEILGEQ